MSRFRLAILVTVVGVAACAGRGGARPGTMRRTAPAMVLGDFTDDYRGRFSISDSIWFQRPRNRFRIVEWHPDEMYLIAQNAPDDPTAPALWTRIDWLSFDDLKPFTWGFCLTTWTAPTRDAARATAPAVRSTPRTGCSGFPFTRMQRASEMHTDSTRR